MKIILTQDDAKLGQKGSVAEVKPGYARNFLMRRGLAVPATAGALKAIQERQASRSKALEIEESKARELGSKIDALDLKFQRASAKGDKLFGSLTAQALVSALKEKGLEVGKRQIVFTKAIHSLGAHTAQIKLHPKVTATLRLTVEAKTQKA